jgi:hypothetical protein
MTYSSHHPAHDQKARQPAPPPVGPPRTPKAAVPPQNRPPAPPQDQLPTQPQYPPPAPRPYAQHAPEDDGRFDTAADSSEVAPSPRDLGIVPAQLPHPLRQRQEGKTGTGRDNDDRVPVRELHAGHVGCQVRISRNHGRDALAGVLAAVQHRQEVRAGDSVVRTDLTVRWSDDSLVQVAVEAGEMLSINPKQWLLDTVEPPAPTHAPRAPLSAPQVVGRHSAAG